MRRIFLLFILLNLIMPQVAYAAPPTRYNQELPSDIALRGAIFAEDASNLYAEVCGDNFCISSSVHRENVMLKFKVTALNARMKHYNGLNVGVTHIADDGSITHTIKQLKPDSQGFAYAAFDFSETIISGLTGTTTFSETGVSGNYTKSFAEVNVSYVDLNITNHQAATYAIGGNDYTYRRLLTLNQTAENLTDIQVQKNQTWYSGMQPDMRDNTYTYFGNDTELSYWDESVTNNTSKITWHKIPSTSIVNTTKIWYYYNNSSMGSASDGEGTFVFFDNFNTLNWSAKWESSLQSSYSAISNELRMTDLSSTANHIRTQQTFENIIVTANIRATSTTSAPYLFLHPTTTWAANEGAYYDNAGGTITAYIGGVSQVESITEDLTNYFMFEIKLPSTGNATSTIYDPNGDIIVTKTAPPSNRSNHISFFEWQSNYAYVDNVSIRQYIETEPTWLADGAEESPSFNIITSVTGDTNTTNYTKDISQTHTLTPTVNITQIVFNTTSTNWDYTATLYWTNDITSTETVTNGEYHANVTATVPLNLDNGTLDYTITNNTLLNADFSNYIQLSTNDSNFNESASNLTLPDISLYTTATTGTYYYDLQYDYFYPVQNLTATPDYTYIALNWNDVSHADQYSVYLDGTLLTNVTDSYYTALGLAAGISYSFDVSVWNNSRQTANTTLPTVTLSTAPAATVNLSLQDIVIPFYAANDTLYIVPIGRVNNTALVQYPAGNVTYNISYNSSVAYSNNSTGVVRINSSVLISVYHLTASGIIHFDNSNSVLLQNTDEISDTVSASAIILNSIYEVISMLGYIIFIIMMWVFAVVVPVKQSAQLLIAMTTTVMYLLTLMDLLPIFHYLIVLILSVLLMTMNYVTGMKNAK